MKPVYLYVMRQPKIPRIKIGISDTPERRRKEIQSESKLRTVIVWRHRCESRKAAQRLESACHKHFADKRTLGEFFEGIEKHDVIRYVVGQRPLWPALTVSALSVGFC